MSFLKDAFDHGRRAAVDALETVGINHSSPWSPEVPDELRSFMPDLVSPSTLYNQVWLCADTSTTSSTASPLCYHGQKHNP